MRVSELLTAIAILSIFSHTFILNYLTKFNCKKILMVSCLLSSIIGYGIILTISNSDYIILSIVFMAFGGIFLTIIESILYDKPSKIYYNKLSGILFFISSVCAILAPIISMAFFGNHFYGNINKFLWLFPIISLLIALTAITRITGNL